MTGRAARASWSSAILALFLLLALVQLGGPASAQGQRAPIKVGVLATFNTPPGEGLLNAAKMAAEEINAAGGVLGRPIELVVANTEMNPQKAATAFQKLVLSDKVVAVVGSQNSGESLAIQEQMARHKIPFINTGAAASSLSQKVEKDYAKYRYWFRVMHTSPEQGQVVVDFLKGYLKPVRHVKKIAILAENAVWTQEIIQMWKDAVMAEGLELVAAEIIDVQTKDFNPSLQKIIKAGADQIIEVSSAIDSAGYIKQWAELQGPPIGGIAASSVSSRFWTDTGGKGLSEWTVNFTYRLAMTPKTLAYFDKYTKTFGISPDYTTGYTYDAFSILAAAIKSAGGTDAEPLVTALEKTDYTGGIGRWVFEKNHNAKYGPGYRQIPIVQWIANGERQVVWPKEFASKDLKFLVPEWWSRK